MVKMNYKKSEAKHKQKIYFWLIVMGSVSILTTLCLDLSEGAQIITAIPFAVALLGGVFQLFRDDIQYMRDEKARADEQLLSLTAISHMSETLFDKHVAFAESYVEELNKVLISLMSAGLETEDWRLVAPLVDIRLNNRLWLSEEITEELVVFEKKIVELIGNNSLSKYEKYYKTNERQEQIENASQMLMEILETNVDMKGRGYSKVISHLQNILRISQLTKLRDDYFLSNPTSN